MNNLQLRVKLNGKEVTFDREPDLLRARATYRTYRNGATTLLFDTVTGRWLARACGKQAYKEDGWYLFAELALTELYKEAQLKDWTLVCEEFARLGLEPKPKMVKHKVIALFHRITKRNAPWASDEVDNAWVDAYTIDPIYHLLNRTGYFPSKAQLMRELVACYETEGPKSDPVKPSAEEELETLKANAAAVVTELRQRAKKAEGYSSVPVAVEAQLCTEIADLVAQALSVKEEQNSD
jgi:hypothetical protein